MSWNETTIVLWGFIIRDRKRRIAGKAVKISSRLPALEESRIHPSQTNTCTYMHFQILRTLSKIHMFTRSRSQITDLPRAVFLPALN